MTNLTIMNQTQTMSSKEIAELTGKNHDHVMRDCRNMFEQLGISEETKIGFLERINNLGHTVKDKHYLLNKEESICLVAGYDANIRMKIIKRWQELEAVTQVIANTLQTDKEAMIKELKQDVTIAKLLASIQASKDKQEASKAKLQALKDKLAKQSEILNAKTTAILARGAKVKGDLVVGKLDLPTDCITELLKAHGSEIEPKLANWALRKLGYLTTDNKVTELGLPFGKTIKASPKAKTTLARWYVNEFDELLRQITEVYDSEFNI